MEFGKTIFVPGKSWKTARVMESRGKVQENDDNVMSRNCTKFKFGPGSAPDPAWRTYSAPPDPVVINRSLGKICCANTSWILIFFVMEMSCKSWKIIVEK